MRPAEAHLNPQEFELLLFGAVDSNNINASDTSVSEVQQHLSGCTLCQSAAVKYRNAEEVLRVLGHGSSRGAASMRRTDCPPEESWLYLAAGLTKGDKAARQVAHAATCDWCGPMLKESIADVAQEDTVKEQEALEELLGDSPGWRREMAKKLAAQHHRAIPTTDAKEKKTGRLKTSFAALAWAACGVAVVVLTSWLVQRTQKRNEPNELLAQAYSLHRTFEPRMAGAAYGPPITERGSTVQELPPQFFEAQKMIHISGHSDDPHLLQAQARADLLEWNYDGALQEIDRALLANPADLSLLLDKATALYERAQKTSQHSQADYKEAAGLLSQVLTQKPNDPVALFNRAIIFQELNRPKEGIADCQNYLRVAPADGWTQEVQSRLERLRKAGGTTLFFYPGYTLVFARTRKPAVRVAGGSA